MTNRPQSRQRMLPAAFAAGSIAFFFTVATRAQESEAPTQPHQAVASLASSSTPEVAPPPSISRTVSSSRAAMMYQRLWGIDSLTLRETASGSVIRFSYRVVDAEKAKVLNDGKQEPYLKAEKNGATLGVPATEKVGKLRQTATPQNGREYWMVFYNSSHAVQSGDKVDIVIGPFHANGLIVEPSKIGAKP